MLNDEYFKEYFVETSVFRRIDLYMRRIIFLWCLRSVFGFRFQITRFVRGPQVRDSFGRACRSDRWHYGEHKHPTGPDHVRQDDRQNVGHDFDRHVHGSAGIASGMVLHHVLTAKINRRYGCTRNRVQGDRFKRN